MSVLHVCFGMAKVARVDIAGVDNDRAYFRGAHGRSGRCANRVAAEDGTLPVCRTTCTMVMRKFH